MKWPNTLTLVRHGESAYNELKIIKKTDSLYQNFLQAYENRQNDPDKAVELARKIVSTKHLNLDNGDHDTALTKLGQTQSESMAKKLKTLIPLPDIILLSPYKRTKSTLEGMFTGWPELKTVTVKEEERIREQEHGLTLAFSDWRVFTSLYPDQEILKALEGPYWYRFPQGENVPDVRERLRSFTTTLTRDYNNKNVLVITHHLSILSLRANLERLSAEEFIRLDEEEKPINCGVTIYKGNPQLGQDGKLLLDTYNAKLY